MLIGLDDFSLSNPPEKSIHIEVNEIKSIRQVSHHLLRGIYNQWHLSATTKDIQFLSLALLQITCPLFTFRTGRGAGEERLTVTFEVTFIGLQNEAFIDWKSNYTPVN